LSPGKRAAAPRLIEWTGERCVPWAPDISVVYEHFHRYLWAAGIVRGLRVLDLGSGEGFGAALLSETAAHVVGIDIDETTVEHSRLNYAGTTVEFDLGTASDLTAYEDGSFGAVVAFEIIEHVADQEQVLSEVSRVLADDGILIMSTPDRVMYEQARTEPNPFHEHELLREEFVDLIGRHFEHVASWGQRTITGSHLNAVDDRASSQEAGDVDFFIERAGDEWRIAGRPAALYAIALASNMPLPPTAASSTLSDCGLELMRVKEREAAQAARERDELSLAQGRDRQELAERLAELSQAREREAADLTAALEREAADLTAALERERADYARTLRDLDARAQIERDQRDQEVLIAQEQIVRTQHAIAHSEQEMQQLREVAASTQQQLGDAQQSNQRAAESVTWQAFQAARGHLYGLLGGERSVRARMFSASLRLFGRRLVRRQQPSAGALTGDTAGAPAAGGPEQIRMPVFDDPEVSLIIPVHAHAGLTRACLHSIREHTTHVRYEVILVDDTSDAGTLQLLEGVRGVKILHNEKNLGFLRSMNRGASVARGKWFVLFNNDTEVTNGWLSAMVACANSAPDVGVVTPKFLYPDGSLNEAGAVVWRDGTALNYGRGDAPDRFQYEYRRETDYGSAAALMVSADLWRDAGGFDERYAPIYYEDTDLCFQARERGLRVLYEPGAVVIHHEGATSGTDLSSGAKRFQERNRKKFVAKWRHTLEVDHRYPAPANARIAANRDRGEHVLVIDHRVPMADHDSGSLRMLSMMRALVRLGARVTFMPANLAPVQPYTRELQDMGIEVLYGQIDIRAELELIGPGLSAAILCRPHAASHWLDTVREYAPAATIAYDTVDLHWLREARRAASVAQSGRPTPTNGNGNPDPGTLPPKASALRELELAMMRATDVTVVVSEREGKQVEHDVPGANVLVVPNVHDLKPDVPPPEGRSGIIFIGGFEHVPNVDAAVCLVREVMPAVWAELGAVKVTIVGSKVPPEVRALASPLVDVAGWVKDLEPLLESSRLLLAPLRYGAGMKGKVTQCMAAGLPVVTTSIGAESLTVASGPDLLIEPDQQCLLIADDARKLAGEAVRLYTDDELWLRLSRGGQEMIEERCSADLVGERLRELLGRASALPAVAQPS